MKLAINGAKPIRTKPWPEKKLYNKEITKKRLCELIDNNALSGYRGSFGQHFWGGKNIKTLEINFEDWLQNVNKHENTTEKYYVLAVNSCTSALQIACGAIGLNPYDEVVVTPWSMTCSASAPMVYGAHPVFADIEKKYFCLDPESIEKQITEKTKAIIVVDLFGQPYDVEKINAIAKKHNLIVIEDAAQAIGSYYDGKQAGTLGDIGCFSFTQGKHFTCGEGGFIVTKNEELYMKCALIRNHAEAVINSMPDNIQNIYYDMSNQQGFNMRMTEAQAIILDEQLKGGCYSDIERNMRRENVHLIKKRIDIDGIDFAEEREGATHSYYVSPFLFDEKIVGVPRSVFIEAVKAELRVETTNMGIIQKIDPLIWYSYITPIYKMPIFKNKYGYFDLSLPNVEELQNEKFCMTTFQGLPLSMTDIADIGDAFNKVFESRKEL
jgi:dTDP-4-amino-4,6-dideoxygalactose transaminase